MSRRPQRLKAETPAQGPDELQLQVGGMRNAVTTVLLDLAEAIRQRPEDRQFAERAVAQIADGWCSSFLSAVQVAADTRQVAVAASLMKTPPAPQ